MIDDPLLTIDEVSELYPEIAEDMRKRGVTMIRRSLIDPKYKNPSPCRPPQQKKPVPMKRGCRGNRRNNQ